MLMVQEIFYLTIHMRSMNLLWICESIYKDINCIVKTKKKAKMLIAITLSRVINNYDIITFSSTSSSASTRIFW
jgi:hypothetical protein